jgi:rfaE bifunctional protein nucleotidyltransferase chain/domain
MSDQRYFHHQAARFRKIASKIYEDRDKLAKRLQVVRTEPREIKVVFTNGCFDLVHPGHVAYLREARALGTHLVVALNTDASVRANKGSSRPILPLKERLKVASSFASVDFVVPFEESTPRDIILALRPDILVKGGDYQLDEIVGREEVASWGGQTLTVPLLEGYSSTNFLRKMRDAADAKRRSREERKRQQPGDTGA